MYRRMKMKAKIVKTKGCSMEDVTFGPKNRAGSMVKAIDMVA